MLIFFLDKLVKKWRLKPRVYVLIFVVGFLYMAFFSAWREEHAKSVALAKELQEAKAEKPDIRFRVEDITLVRTPIVPPTDSVVVLYLTVRNLGPMPSAVEGYSFTVEVPKRGVFTAEIIPLSDAVVFQTAEGDFARFSRDDAIYNKTLKPISQGAIEKGIMTLHLRGVTEAEMINTTYTLRWRDVQGKPGSIKALLTRAPEGWRPPFIPGLEGSPVPSVSPAKGTERNSKGDKTPAKGS